MSVILVISSQVVCGYVGGSATRTILEGLGHRVWLVPTVILSNHPGHAEVTGEQVPAERIGSLLDGLERNGWLAEIDMVMTGYLPTRSHGEQAAAAIDRVVAAQPSARVVCDPILGDDPDGLYVDESAAATIRDSILPRAGLATPNRFELEWLTGLPVTNPAQAVTAALALPQVEVLASSIPGNAGGGTLHDMILSEDGSWRTTIERRDVVPHGIGDLLAALYLGHAVNSAPPKTALARASAGVQAALNSSPGPDDLPLPQIQPLWAQAPLWPVEELAV